MVRRIILRVPNKTARRKDIPVHIPIHPSLFAFLNQTPKSQRSGYVLPEFAAKYQRNSSDVAKELRHHFVACGIQVHQEGTGVKLVEGKDGKKKTREGKRAVVEVGFHSLRHSFVSLCRQSNAPLAVVEAIVGHSNPAMTRHYTHVGEVAASQAVAALPALGTADAVLQTSVAEPTDRQPDPANAKETKRLLSAREQKMAAILGRTSAKTWLKDRDALLTLLLG
jgi:integrase